MVYIFSIIIGLIAGYAGFIPPAMLNMNVARTSMEHGKRQGIIFAFGVTVIVFVQVLIAVSFSGYLIANPQIITGLKTVAIFVLFILAIYFFIKARKDLTLRDNQNGHNAFLTGMLMSSLNMFAMPYHFGIVIMLEYEGWLPTEFPHGYLYALGATIGAFCLFITYVYLAKIIARRAQFIAHNINYILSGMFVVLAIMVIIEKFHI